MSCNIVELTRFSLDRKIIILLRYFNTLILRCVHANYNIQCKQFLAEVDTTAVWFIPVYRILCCSWIIENSLSSKTVAHLKTKRTVVDPGFLIGWPSV